MKKQQSKLLTLSAAFFTAFVLWTVLVSIFDVKPIGPLGSSVGFATFNQTFHGLTGVHLWLYFITDWLGLVPIGIALGFAVLGLIQLIRRKSILKVDRDILVLGGFYIATFSVYCLFEAFPVNYRPILIDGFLEASYPSSTTLLVSCIMPTAISQLGMRIKREKARKALIIFCVAFTFFTVAARIISGVHWISDIIGGALISASLVLAYYALKN